MGLNQGKWLFHALISGAVMLDGVVGGTSGAAPARTAVPPPPGLSGMAIGPVTLTAVDARDPATRYRVVTGSTGPIVEESSDSGAHWTVLLTGAQQLATQTPAGVVAGVGCAPASYTAVRVLKAATAASGPRLYIATAGTPGNYLDFGCSSAQGGLFAVQSSGSVTALGSAGLPYDQDPAGRTIRAYDVDMVIPDPTQSATLYVHASQGVGPGSPPEGLYRSTDGGQHWAEIDTGLRPSTVITNSVGLAVPVYDPGTLTISPASAQRLTWATDTGTYVSDDGGAHWRRTGPAAVAPPALLPTSTPPVPASASVPQRRVAPIPAGTRTGASTALRQSAASGPFLMGLDEGWAVDNNGNVLVTSGQVTTTQSAGARYVRVNFRLGGAASWTAQLLNTYNTAIQLYRSAGIQVLGLVTPEATKGNTQADWTANNYENTGGDGHNPFIDSTYTSALVTLVSYFDSRGVKLWELWNEPNGATSCSGTVCSGGSFIYPSNFAALLVDAYQATKDAGFSDVTLVSGGIFGHSIGGVHSAHNAGACYLYNTFAMGTGTNPSPCDNLSSSGPGNWQTFMSTHPGAFPYPLDALGQHLYIDQGGSTTSSNISSYYSWLRDAMLPFVANGSALPPTYMTEGAWPSPSLTQDIQAQNLDILFQTSRSMGFVQAATWFELYDNPANNTNFGLIQANGTPKASFAHYQGQASESIIQLNAGWNLISLPLAPSGTLYASALLAGVRQSGGSLAAIYGLSGGRWSPSLISAGSSSIGNDFTLQAGSGYLLYTDQAASYTETGSVPTGTPTWSLTFGWNLVGVPANAPSPLDALTVLNGVLAANANSALAAIYALSNGRWTPSLIEQRNGATIGSNFTLQQGAGYLLYTDQNTTYVLGSTAVPRARAGATPATIGNISLPALPPPSTAGS